MTKRTLLTVVFLCMLFYGSFSSAAPSWKIPLEKGYSYLVTVGYGGVTFDGGVDIYHSDVKNGYYAIDFDNPVNCLEPKVVAAYNGLVVQVFNDPDSGYGYGVKLDHGNGFSSIYGHFKEKPVVNVGDFVFQGQTLGIMGKTGISTGTHLHFAVYYNGECKSTVLQSKPEPISGYSNIKAGQMLFSDNYFNQTNFTFPLGSSEGMKPNWSMIEKPLIGVDEWRVQVSNDDPGVDSPEYPSGLVAKSIVIEFSAKVISGGNPVSEGKVYIKDETGSWINSVPLTLINSEFNYNGGQFALNVQVMPSYIQNK